MNNETKHQAVLSNSAKHTAALTSLDKSLTTELLLCEDASAMLIENNDRILIRGGNPWVNLAKSI